MDDETVGPRFAKMDAHLARPDDDLARRDAEWAVRNETLARQHAKRSEELGKLDQPVADALHSEGLLGMWVPRTVRGGLELDPVTSLEVIESVSRSCSRARACPSSRGRARDPA